MAKAAKVAPTKAVTKPVIKVDKIKVKKQHEVVIVLTSDKKANLKRIIGETCQFADNLDVGVRVYE